MMDKVELLKKELKLSNGKVNRLAIDMLFHKLMCPKSSFTIFCPFCPSCGIKLPEPDVKSVNFGMATPLPVVDMDKFIGLSEYNLFVDLKKIIVKKLLYDNKISEKEGNSLLGLSVIDFYSMVKLDMNIIRDSLQPRKKVVPLESFKRVYRKIPVPVFGGGKR